MDQVRIVVISKVALRSGHVEVGFRPQSGSAHESGSDRAPNAI